MKKQLDNYLKGIFIVLDILILNFSFLICHLLFIKYEDVNPSSTQIWIISNATWLIISFILGSYSNKAIKTFKHFTKSTIQVFSLWLIVILFYLFFNRGIDISRLFMASFVVAVSLGLLINRFLYIGLWKYFRRSPFMHKNVAIVGYNETAKKLTQYFEEENLNYNIVGFFENASKIMELSNYPILSNTKNVLEISKKLNVHEIFSTITPEEDKEMYNLMHAAEKECIRFKIIPNLSNFIERPVHIEYYNQLAVLSLRSEPLDDVANRLKKRALDLIISTLVLIFILSWLIPILSIIILIESGRPVFFKQERTGKNNEPFLCLKLRSMKVNKEANTKQATLNDKRITWFGRFLRKTSLDEMPQFINVFKGEMSLVGPRPHMVKHTNDYSEIVDEYMVRQFIKPGITGWAQINGYRGEISNPEQIRMRVNKDLWYLENWSLWLDIQILFLTVYYVFKGDENAY